MLVTTQQFTHFHECVCQPSRHWCLPCRLMVNVAGCSPVCERMNENSAAGTHRVTLLSSTVFLLVLHSSTDTTGRREGEAMCAGACAELSTSPHCNACIHLTCPNLASVSANKHPQGWPSWICPHSLQSIRHPASTATTHHLSVTFGFLLAIYLLTHSTGQDIKPQLLQCCLFTPMPAQHNATHANTCNPHTFECSTAGASIRLAATQWHQGKLLAGPDSNAGLPY